MSVKPGRNAGLLHFEHKGCSIHKRGEFFITDYSSSLTEADMLGDTGIMSAALWVRFSRGRREIETF
jgi:hypothetical protein